MEEREELTDLPCVFVVLFFNRVKYTFFKIFLFGERDALDFLMKSSIISVELFFNFSLFTFPLPLSHSKRH